MKRKIIFIIVLISILIKLVFLFASGAYKNPEVYEYEQVAGNLMAGKGFYYDHFNTKYYSGIAPGYPLLCVMLYKLFGYNHLWVILMQILLTSLLVIPVYLIALRIFGEKEAFFSALLCAVQPQLIIYSTSKLHSMNIYSLIFAALVLSFLRLKENPVLKNIYLTGFIGGLATLFRVTSVVFFCLGMLWFYLISKEKIKIYKIIQSFLVFLVLIIPWGIRNYIVFKKPLMLQTNKWESFWYGNMPGSSGSLFTEGNITVFDKGRNELPTDFFEKNEIEQGLYLKKITVGYFKKDPFSFIARIFKKIFYFWYFSPYQGAEYPGGWKVLYKIYYLFILFPAIVSIFNSLIFNKSIDKAGLYLILLFFLAITGSHSLYFVEGRHRWSIESLLLIFTANGFFILKNGLYKIIHKG